MVSPKPYSHGGKPNPKPILGKPNPNPQQVHLHEKDDPAQEEIPETPTQAMVHECLVNVIQTPQTSKMSCQFLMPIVALHHKNPQENFKSTKDMSLPEPIDLQII